jgi:hypothetical protein
MSSSTGSFGPFGVILATLPPFPGNFKLIDMLAEFSCWWGAEGERFCANLHDRIQRQMWVWLLL